MENATEALMMAFGMLIFGIAITLTMSMFSQARQTADYILYQKDESNYYEFETGITDDDITNGRDGTERLVGIETIIPTLYKYYKENFKVVFQDRDNKPLAVAPTVAIPPSGWVNPYPGLSDHMISSFDIKEETERREVWTSSEEIRARNLYYFLFGGDYTINNRHLDYGVGFIETYRNANFIEKIGYEMQGTEESTGSATNKLKGQQKKVIFFILQ